MLLDRILRWSVVFVLHVYFFYCDAQYLQIRFNNGLTTTPPTLPFPTCRADDIDCLRRGLRTFFFLMDTGHLGMKPVDPFMINSIALNYGDEQLSFLLRRVNVTGARWTKLVDRRFNLVGGKSGVIFTSDLHVTGEISMSMPERLEPFVGSITMDIQDVESNITYTWTGEKRIDTEDYIIIGPERIAVRNAALPTYFLQSNEDSMAIDQQLQLKPSVVDHLANELVAALMHGVVDNFRQFANNVPVKYFYKYY